MTIGRITVGFDDRFHAIDSSTQGEPFHLQTCANGLAIDFAARVVCSGNDGLEQIRDFGERTPRVILGQVRVRFSFPDASIASRCCLVCCSHQVQLAAYSTGKGRLPESCELQCVQRQRVGWVAQSVEQRTENPCVGGSIPSPATTSITHAFPSRSSLPCRAILWTEAMEIPNSCEMACRPLPSARNRRMASAWTPLVAGLRKRAPRTLATRRPVFTRSPMISLSNSATAIRTPNWRRRAGLSLLVSIPWLVRTGERRS